MNPHEVERTIAGIFCGALFILGGLIGSFAFWGWDDNLEIITEVK